MASITNDLKYLSRYGYRDPWAEAVKSVSDNLFSLADSKMRRDMLIADFQDKKQARADSLANQGVKNMIDVYQATPDEDKHFVLPKLEKVFSGVDGGAELFDGLSKASKSRQEYRTEFDQLSEATGDIQKDYENAKRLAEMAETSQDVAFANNKLRLRGASWAEEVQKTNTTNLINELSTAGWISKDNANEYQKRVDEGDWEGARNWANAAATRSANKQKTIQARHEQLFKNYNSMLKEFGTKGAPTIIADNELKSFENLSRPHFPTKYQSPNMTYDDALYRWSVGEPPSTTPPSAATTTKKATDAKDKTPPPPKYVPINEISDENISLPKTSLVSLINTATDSLFKTQSGAVQKFTGDIARRMIESGQGTLAKDSAILKFSWGTLDDNLLDRGMSYESPEKPGFFSVANRENRHSKITLNSGDEVTEIKTGKKYNVIIDSPSMAKTVDQIRYIVNGKSYNWKEFMSKFGKSLYDVKPGDDAIVDEFNRRVSNIMKVHSVTKVVD